MTTGHKIGARVLNTKAPRMWTEVFSATRLPQVYYVRGTRALCSRAWCRCESHLDWHRAVEFLKAEGIGEERTGSGSPANATTYEYRFACLDGGLETVGGDYWGGRHGAYVTGIATLRFLCYGLGLTQPRRQPKEEFVPTLGELRLNLAAGKAGVAQDADILARLWAVPLPLRCAVVGEDVYQKRDRYASIAPHDLAEILGVKDSDRPGGGWGLTAYAPIRALDEQMAEKDAYEEWIDLLRGQVSEERARELEPEFAKFADDPDHADSDFTFLSRKERRLIEEALAREDLEGHLLNGISTIARYSVTTPAGELLFEGDVEDDGACIYLRTPYECRDGKAVDLDRCVTEEWG